MEKNNFSLLPGCGLKFLVDMEFHHLSYTKGGNEGEETPVCAVDTSS